MKLRLTLCTIAALLLCCGMAHADGWVFGVKPGGHINTSYFGMERGNLVFYGGLDLLRISAEYNMSSTETNGSTYTYDSELKGSALMLIPRIGAKFRISSHALRPYLYADVFKAFPSVTLEGSETSGGVTVSVQLTDYEDYAKDILGIFGFNIGFGAEYYFSEHFSLGGEYSFRWISTSATDEGTESYRGYTETWEDELKASLMASYANAVLNFYF